MSSDHKGSQVVMALARLFSRQRDTSPLNRLSDTSQLRWDIDGSDWLTVYAAVPSRFLRRFGTRAVECISRNPAEKQHEAPTLPIELRTLKLDRSHHEPAEPLKS